MNRNFKPLPRRRQWPEVRFDKTEFEHTEKESLKTKALTQALENAAERRNC